MSDEKPTPLLKVIYTELRARGWRISAEGGYYDPDGNLFFTLEDAVRAQSLREIAEFGKSSPST